MIGYLRNEGHLSSSLDRYIRLDTFKYNRLVWCAEWEEARNGATNRYTYIFDFLTGERLDSKPSPQ